MIRQSIEDEGRRIAEELGVIYTGPQYYREELYCHLFTDPLTRGTFAGINRANAWQKFLEMREAFGAPLPENVPPDIKESILQVKGGDVDMTKPRNEEERKTWHERIFGAGSEPPGERKGLGQTTNSLLPMPPESGPPLPRALGIRWPWGK